MRFRSVLLAISLGLVSAPSMADVGMSITVGEPGFFGHIEIGDAPRPVLVAPAAVIIEPAPPRVVVQPLYLYVPSAERKDWRRHCGRYHACGRPVYFVRESWYRDVYVPHYRQHRVEYDRLYGREYSRRDHDDRRDREDHRDDRRDRDDDQGHQNRSCPPGQAKKGNC